MERECILIIVGNPIIRESIGIELQKEGFRVIHSSNGAEGLKVARRHPPDFIILDARMPVMDGFTMCKEIRADPVINGIPILLLTLENCEQDRIRGLQAGADDCLGRPFSLTEFILRIKAILRRTITQTNSKKNLSWDEKNSGVTLQRTRNFPIMNTSVNELGKRNITIGEYTLNTRAFTIHTPHAGSVELTPRQYDLLYHLMCHRGQIFTTARLLEEVWNYPTDSCNIEVVRVHIRNLRKRIEKDPKSPQFIRTVPGYGYTIGDVGN